MYTYIYSYWDYYVVVLEKEFDEPSDSIASCEF
jgi:hypothetical protein